MLAVWTATITRLPGSSGFPPSGRRVMMVPEFSAMALFWLTETATPAAMARLELARVTVAPLARDRKLALFSAWSFTSRAVRLPLTSALA